MLKEFWLLVIFSPWHLYIQEMRLLSTFVVSRSKNKSIYMIMRDAGMTVKLLLSRSVIRHSPPPSVLFWNSLPEETCDFPFYLTVHVGTESSRNSVAVSALTIYYRGSVQYGGIRMEILMTVRKIASICTMVRSWDSALLFYLCAAVLSTGRAAEPGRSLLR